MEKFVKQEIMIHPKTKATMTVEQFGKLAMGSKDIEVWKNDKYQVIKRVFENKANVDAVPNLVWLSIKRIDKEPCRDWRDFQVIKNELVGEECEGVELYPAESRVVDLANQFHLWCFSDPSFRLPFGFGIGAKGGVAEAEAIGAKQREFDGDEKKD